MTTCCVWSDVAVRIEVGLERGANPEHRGCLSPGPNHQTHQLNRGINHGVPRALVGEWMRRNRKYVEAIRDGRIRIVEEQPETAAA
jgi:hypothetical protein